MAEEQPTSDAPAPSPPPAGKTRRRIRRDPTAARKSAPSKTRVWRERAHLPLAACVVAAPLLFGGAFGWTMVVTAFLAAIGAGTVWLAYRRELAAIPASIPLVVCALLLVWTCVQALPLPTFLVRVLAPASAEAVALSARAAGTAVPWFCAITRDPGGTAMEIVKGTAIIAALAAAWALANVGRREQLVRIAAVSVLVLVVVGAAHLAIGVREVYGIYQPLWSSSTIPGPLMNGNHVGGFAAMGVPLMILLGAETRLPGARIGWFLAAAATSVATVWTLSRGGIGSLILGVAVLSVLLVLVRNKRADSTRRQALPWVAFGVATALVVAAWVASDAFFEAFRDHDVSKLAVAGSSLKLAWAAPIFGVGRGAFSAAFAAHDGPIQRFVVPENLPAQWVVEWGVPASVALAVVLLTRLVSAVAVTQIPGRAAACAAVISIAAHDLVDFSLEMVGVAVVAAVVLAAALAPDHEREGVPPDRGRWWPSVRTVLAASAVAAVVAGGALFHRVHGTSVLELQASLERASDRHDDAAFRSTLTRALALHPSEPAFFLLGASHAADAGDPSTGRWLTRAMQLAPQWASPHVVAATWMWKTGRPGQALLELREAATRAPGQAVELGCWIGRQTRDARTMLRAAPTGPTHIVFLDAVAGCLPSDQAAIIDHDLLARSPHLVTALERQAQRDLDAGRTRVAVTAMQGVVRRTPEDADAQVLLARALVADGQPLVAARALTDAARHLDDPTPVLVQQARVLAVAGDEAGMRRSVEQLRGLAGGSPAKLAAAMMLLGELEQSRGNIPRALRAFDEAQRFDPASGGLSRVATLSESLGDLRGAFRAYSELCDVEGPSSPGCVARDRLAGAGGEPALPLEQPTTNPLGPGPLDPP